MKEKNDFFFPAVFDDFFPPRPFCVDSRSESDGITFSCSFTETRRCYRNDDRNLHFSIFPLRYDVNLGSRRESRVEILIEGRVNVSPEIVEKHLSFYKDIRPFRE